MTEKEFQDGVALIDTCMQGTPDVYEGTKLVKPGTNFDHKFLDHLFKVIKETPNAAWMKVVQRISSKPCKPRDLNLADFLSEIDSYNERLRWEKDRWKVTPAPPPANVKAVYERILADPEANDLAKSIARKELAKAISVEPGSGERPKGGEKYRRMKERQPKTE